jgi:hypothetical protein
MTGKAMNGNECPPAGATAEGLCPAVEASADQNYSGTGQGGKAICQALKGPNRRDERAKRSNGRQVAYCDSTGRKWAYSGKRARILEMLATVSGGVTQWDCLPWHTRLGGTIHAMRRDGLAISTEREGEYRHARYRLETRGSLILQRENSDGPGGKP